MRASESEEIHLWINIGAHPYQYRLQTEVGNFSASSGIENCITGIPQYFTNCLKYVMCIIDDELLTLGKGGHIQIDVPHFLTFFADRAYHFLPSATGGGIASRDLTFVYRWDFKQNKSRFHFCLLRWTQKFDCDLEFPLLIWEWILDCSLYSRCLGVPPAAERNGRHQVWTT